jgi:spore coat polysaccharide biosynthesis predicted glycosyltransferase SpsG
VPPVINTEALSRKRIGLLLLLYLGLYPSDMLPKKVLFAANATMTSGAGHLRRLIEIVKVLPKSIEKLHFGHVEMSWLDELVNKSFDSLELQDSYGQVDIVILDSYDKEFCLEINSKFKDSVVIQIADRYTFLLPNTLLVFMDLPFEYGDIEIASRTIAHGIEFLPKRQMGLEMLAFQEKAKRVLVTTGGTLNTNIFNQLINELEKIEYEGIQFEFIGVPKSMSRENKAFQFYQFGHSFDTIVGDCDTAISAAGTTMWDLMANRKILGLAATVENQKANFSFAVSSKQALPVFNRDNQKLEIDNLRALLFDRGTRHALYSASLGNHDFNGAERTWDSILAAFQKVNKTRG